MRCLVVLMAGPALRLTPPVMRLGQPAMRLGHRRENYGDAADAYSTVQGGGSLRTWAQRGPSAGQRHVHLSSEGRPINANVEIWKGPDDTPCGMRVYSENGMLRPFQAVIGHPGDEGTTAIRNVGELELPLQAAVGAGNVESPTAAPSEAAATTFSSDSATTIQGGALRTFSFRGDVGSVRVSLSSERLPIYAVIELLQGPNSKRQAIELYTDNGRDRPIQYLLETPGGSCSFVITNVGPVAFPMKVAAEVGSLRPDADAAAVLGGDVKNADERRRLRSRYDAHRTLRSEGDLESDLESDGRSRGRRRAPQRYRPDAVPHGGSYGGAYGGAYAGEEELTRDEQGTAARTNPRNWNREHLRNPMAYGTSSVPSYTSTNHPERPRPAQVPARAPARAPAQAPAQAPAALQESAADVVVRAEALMEALMANAS